MGEGECEGCIIGEVEARDSIAYWREQRGAIWSEDEVSFSVDGAQEIGELLGDQRLALSRESKEAP